MILLLPHRTLTSMHMTRHLPRYPHCLQRVADPSPQRTLLLCRRLPAFPQRTLTARRRVRMSLHMAFSSWQIAGTLLRSIRRLPQRDGLSPRPPLFSSRPAGHTSRRPRHSFDGKEQMPQRTLSGTDGTGTSRHSFVLSSHRQSHLLRPERPMPRRVLTSWQTEGIMPRRAGTSRRSEEDR